MADEKQIFSPGTQVVVKKEVKGGSGAVLFPPGAVAVVVKSPVDPTHPYRVRFPDGNEFSLKRYDFEIRKHHQKIQTTENKKSEENASLFDHVIYRCVVGSRAYGLENEESDTDLRGIYLPPADIQWSLFGIPEQLEQEETQECYWELQKFLTLAIKANPNVLECLYSPLTQVMKPPADHLLEMKEAFLSKLVYQTYNGYVLSQFRKIEGDLRNLGKIKWKHAMHLVRLLLSGITALKEQYIPVQVKEKFRDRLLVIRNGEEDWDSINTWRKELHKEFDEAFQHTKLPDRPDYERINQFLIMARRSVV